MKKPTVRGPKPSGKAHRAFREELDRESKPLPPLPKKGQRIWSEIGKDN
jgi:hypothetical protein